MKKQNQHHAAGGSGGNRPALIAELSM